jgi:hypothetical protein
MALRYVLEKAPQSRNWAVSHSACDSKALGLADNSHDVVRSFNASVSNNYDHTWSLTAGRTSIGGTADPALYDTFTGSPNNGSWLIEIVYLPFGSVGPSFWLWLNMRSGLQYTLWDKADSASTNFNGAGHNGHNHTRSSPTSGSYSVRQISTSSPTSMT